MVTGGSRVGQPGQLVLEVVEFQSLQGEDRKGMVVMSCATM